MRIERYPRPWLPDLLALDLDQGHVKETLGAIDQPMSFRGVTVNPGDLVIGDNDGLVVIPLAEIETVLAIAKKREEKEVRMRAELAKGRTNWDISKFNALPQRNGIDIEL